MKPERLARTVIHTSPWVNLYVDRVRFPNGSIVERHHLVDMPPSVVALGEGDQGILLVRVPRYTTGDNEWELPAGGVEDGETAMAAARRETLEETGYETTGHEHVYTYNPLPGIARKWVYVVRCRATERVAQYDENEVSQVRWFARDEIERMIAEGEMTDGVSLLAFLLCPS